MMDYEHLHKQFIFIYTFNPCYPPFMCWWEGSDIHIVYVPE